jgi:hypothetical protein
MGIENFWKGIEAGDQMRRTRALTDEADFRLQNEKEANVAPADFLNALNQSVSETWQAPANQDEQADGEIRGWTGTQTVTRNRNVEEKLQNLLQAVAKNPQATQSLMTVAQLDPDIRAETSKLAQASAIAKERLKYQFKTPHDALMEQIKQSGRMSVQEARDAAGLTRDIFKAGVNPKNNTNKPTSLADLYKKTTKQKLKDDLGNETGEIDFTTGSGGTPSDWLEARDTKGNRWINAPLHAKTIFGGDKEYNKLMGLLSLDPDNQNLGEYWTAQKALDLQKSNQLGSTVDTLMKKYNVKNSDDINNLLAERKATPVTGSTSSPLASGGTIVAGDQRTRTGPSLDDLIKPPSLNDPTSFLNNLFSQELPFTAD